MTTMWCYSYYMETLNKTFKKTKLEKGLYQYEVGTLLVRAERRLNGKWDVNVFDGKEFKTLTTASSLGLVETAIKGL